MRTNSLAFRLFVAAAAWALVVLPITGFVLVSVYRNAVERSFDSRLNAYLTTLVANAATSRDTAGSRLPSLGEPLFSLPFSGWYWQITPLGQTETSLLTSESLLDQRITLPRSLGIVADENRMRKAYVDGPENQHVRVVEREITLEEERAAPGRRLSVAVAGNSAEIDGDIAEFRTLLAIALSILGAGLVLATLFQVRFGLKPLRAIGQGLAAIRSGKAEKLEGDLPSEIVPLQSELNALIQSNRAIVERARTHAGNLAHALKTPLSVITNEAQASRSGFARKVQEQAQIMRDQISHHLNRASIAARAGVISGHTSVKPVLEALVRALERIYADRDLDIRLQCPPEVAFHGEKHDLEEMIGNLLDNACKWAEKEVSMTVTRRKDSIILVVEDDGPGLPEKEREAALKRGKRLDETKPGSGLGLSIVSELTHLYGGEYSLENREKNGLRARLVLPGS